MKVFISADMEGTAGVTDWDQVMPGRPDYARFRRLMTEEVNAGVRESTTGRASLTSENNHCCPSYDWRCLQ